MNENPHDHEDPSRVHSAPSDINDEDSPDSTAESPIDVIRRVLDENEWQYEGEGDFVQFGLALNALEVAVICTAEAHNLAAICVRLHIRAPEARRAAVGEFLHRLNYAATRKVWETDYDDGEIRLHAYTDLINCPLTEVVFGSMLEFLTFQAEAVFPYLTGVINGHMKPLFAADQAQAALSKKSSKGTSNEGSEED